MKKVITLIAIVLTLVSLTSCNNNEPVETAETERVYTQQSLRAEEALYDMFEAGEISAETLNRKLAELFTW